MISLKKWIILAPLQKLANNVGDLGKIIVATSFEWLPKVQKIAQSGHTGLECMFIYTEKIAPTGAHFMRKIFTGDLHIFKHSDWLMYTY